MQVANKFLYNQVSEYEEAVSLCAGHSWESWTGEGAYTILHYVLCCEGRSWAGRLLRHLVEQGCPVDAQEGSGATPLLIAVDRQEAELVESLLACGADPDVKDALGNSPQMYAEALTWGTGLELLAQSRGEEAQR